MSCRTPILCFVAFLMLSAQHASSSQAATSAEVIGTFFNEAKMLIELEIISKDGRERTVIPITPGRIDRAVIVEGQIRLYLPAESRSSRQLLGTTATPTRTSARGFLDRAAHTFYFRITGMKMSLVKLRDLTSDERKRLKAAMRELQR